MCRINGAERSEVKEILDLIGDDADVLASVIAEWLYSQGIRRYTNVVESHITKDNMDLITDIFLVQTKLK